LDLTFALAWLVTVAGYILYVKRRAIDDEGGVQLRGMLSAIFLEIALMGAMLM
jgi:hypothetical protein